MANVSANLDAEVATDGAGLGVLGVGLAQHDPSGLDDVEAFLDYRDDRAACQVLAEAGVEGPAGEVSIVLLQQVLRSLHELHRKQLEALLLKSLQNLPDQTTLDAVGLDHDEGSLLVGLGSHDGEEVGAVLFCC